MKEIHRFKRFLIGIDNPRFSAPLKVYRKVFGYLPKEGMKIGEKYDLLPTREERIDKELIKIMEESLINDDLSVYQIQGIFNLFNLFKIKLSQQTLVLLKKRYLSLKDFNIVSSFANYLYSLKIAGNCDFFATILEEYGKEDIHQIGDIAILAANLKCLKCKKTIEEIIKCGNNVNPRKEFGLKEALKIFNLLE